jgi:2-desacetyl-2-hydroxyethyl bacteriochlorophyllide A dehydrogenase
VQRKSVYFVSKGRIEIRKEFLPKISSNQMVVQSIVSAISPGTELLFYHGQVPNNIKIDTTIPGLNGKCDFPLKYGYAVVGKVVEIGSKVDANWLDKIVFAFHPHENKFLATPEDLIPIPEDLPVEKAIFLASMETAVNFLMDGKPFIGEQVVVFGQGIIGLLTTALLAQLPVSFLLTFDKYALRRENSLSIGANDSLDPSQYQSIESVKEMLKEKAGIDCADLIYELSGKLTALQQAIQIAGFEGRIVIGSWYGDAEEKLSLGSHFHRNRIQLTSSQVSTVASLFGGRWDKKRRIQVALKQLQKLELRQLITHQIPFENAPEAYELIDKHPEKTIQVLLTY